MHKLKITLAGVVCGLLSIVHPQSYEERAAVMQAIQSGKLKVTDEMIEEQRRLHPELKEYSNQEIKDQLEGKGGGKSHVDTLEDTRKSKDKKAKEPLNKRKPNFREIEKENDNEDENEKAQFPDALKKEEKAGRFPSGMARFGYDFFVNNPNAGISSNNTPALPEYVLSPSDEIQVYTWGRENQSQTIVIDNEGMFRYPPLPPVRLAGMKFMDAQKLLTAEIEKINGVKASVGLGKLKSIRIFVLGEAVNPGSYVVPAGATVTSALFQSGGITEIGSLRGIQIKRAGKVLATLDLYEMLMKGSNVRDAQLMPGDVIFVPVASIQVAITGMVKRPGIYEVKPGTKVLSALELGGGLSSNAFKGRVRLDRIENHQRKIVLDIGMEKMAGNANTVIQDGDILNVEEVLSREYDVVYLEGNVNRPGRFEYKKGMTIKDLIPGVKDLKTETFFTYGHIKRSSDDEQRSLLLPFSLKDVFENGNSVPLMPRDTIMIYSKFDIMDQPEVRISGVVRRPGKYPFVDKMRISDLIMAGGGLTSEAYLFQAHLIRALKVQESDSLYSTLLKVNLANLIDNPGDENNLELQASDSLMIFPRGNFILQKTVTISGGVKKPGVYELTRNMGIPELIGQAEGLNRNTYKLKIEVIRGMLENDSVVKREVHRMSLKEIINGRAKFDLQDGDAIYIREAVDSKSRIRVKMDGEFNFPGQYEAAKDERLGSVIRRAGGFSGNSYLRAAVFIRQSVKDRQLNAVDELDRRLQGQLANMLAQTTNEKDRATIESAISQRKMLLQEIRNAPYLGRVVVHLDQSYKFENSEEDVRLEPDDSLFIPPLASTISILGEVYSPTNLVVSPRNNTISECIAKAGGINEFGDEDNVYYLQPDGTVITPKNTTFFGWRKVEPGGTIIVPAKGPKKDYLDALAKITQIIYQIAISVGVAKTVF